MASKCFFKPLVTVPLVPVITSIIIHFMFHTCIVRRDSAVGITTCYGRDGAWIESRGRWDFPHPSRLSLVSTHPPVEWVLGLFPRGKTAGVKERVELYCYFSFGPSWPVLGWTFNFLLSSLAYLPYVLRECVPHDSTKVLNLNVHILAWMCVCTSFLSFRCPVLLHIA
jgi:hypothetical protein